MKLLLSTRALSIGAALFIVFVALPFSLLAQSGTTLPTVPITVEQQNPEGIISKWTLLSQMQQELIGNEKTQQVSIPVGNYTFFIEQPKGYTARIILYKGNLVVTTVDSPQLSFVFNGETNIKILAQLTLTNVGQVGVISSPIGIPFKLGGPNQMSKEGVTPADYQNMPIGQYNVIYMPNGCPQTPPKSNELKKDGRVSFNVTIKCSAMSSAAAASSAAATLTPMGPAAFPFVTLTAADGTWLMFRDVPLEAWFANFVKNAATKGIMSGYKDADGKSTDYFGPENPVTLEEVAAAVERAAGIQPSGGPTQNWYVEEWAAPYIAAAEELKWKVYSDPEKDITEPATRAEVVSTILQAFAVPLRWPNGTVFLDVGRGDDSAGEIETAAALGIVAGRKDENGVLTGIFDPEGWINRAEMAKIVMLTLETLRGSATHSSSVSSKAVVRSSSSSSRSSTSSSLRSSSGKSSSSLSSSSFSLSSSSSSSLLSSSSVASSVSSAASSEVSSASMSSQAAASSEASSS